MTTHFVDRITIAVEPLGVTTPATARMTQTRAVNTIVRQICHDGDIAHRPNGAPYLSSHPDMAISISHSAEYAAVAIADCHRVFGIDIEAPRPRLSAVYPRFVNARDRLTDDALGHDTVPDTDTLLKLWTAKEAAFKAWSAANPDRKAYLADFAVDLTGDTAITPDGLKLTLRFIPHHHQLLTLAYLPTI